MTIEDWNGKQLKTHEQELRQTLGFRKHSKNLHRSRVFIGLEARWSSLTRHRRLIELEPLRAIIITVLLHSVPYCTVPGNTLLSLSGRQHLYCIVRTVHQIQEVLSTVWYSEYGTYNGYVCVRA